MSIFKTCKYRIKLSRLFFRFSTLIMVHFRFRYTCNYSALLRRFTLSSLFISLCLVELPFKGIHFYYCFFILTFPSSVLNLKVFYRNFMYMITSNEVFMYMFPSNAAFKIILIGFLCFYTSANCIKIFFMFILVYRKAL